NVVEKEGVLTLEGRLFKGDEEGESDWQVFPIDAQRVFLQTKRSRAEMAPKIEGMASCNSDIFANLMSGMNRRRWTGVITVDTHQGIKKIYFQNGEVTFARSNVID